MQRQLPAAILAFFYMSPVSRELAQRTHANFLAAFNVSEESCPLVGLNLDADEPFTRPKARRHAGA